MKDRGPYKRPLPAPPLRERVAKLEGRLDALALSIAELAGRLDKVEVATGQGGKPEMRPPFR